jgi:hypothetical protein
MDENYMEVGDHEMLKTWNRYSGPKYQARQLQERLRISNSEVMDYINSSYGRQD